MNLSKTILLLLIAFTWQNLTATEYLVGPQRTYKFCSDVEKLLKDGDTLSIDTALYSDDRQVTFTASRLLIRGVGGMPELRAGNKIAQDPTNGKGIFVISGNNTTVKNIKFTNAKVKSNNGAGIRQQGANLLVQHCVFDGNEMGILAGGTISNCTIIIEYSEFLNGGSTANPGYQHNIYINHIDTFIFRFNYTHDAIAEGHELKSRASFNLIAYNRIANLTSNDSRNIDIPNGGVCILLGNIIEQNENSVNSNIIGYGLEGLTNAAPHNLWLSHNTIVNKKSKGSFIQVSTADSVGLYNNIFVGAKTGGFILGTATYLDSFANLVNDNTATPMFTDMANADYSLTASSWCVNRGKSVGYAIGNQSLNPIWQYSNINKTARSTDGKPDIGAYEYVRPAAIQDIQNSYFRVYPNPAIAYLQVVTENLQPQSFQIITSEGKLIKTVFVKTSDEHIPVADLPVGLYLLRGLQSGVVIGFIKVIN